MLYFFVQVVILIIHNIICVWCVCPLSTSRSKCEGECLTATSCSDLAGPSLLYSPVRGEDMEH